MFSSKCGRLRQDFCIYTCFLLLQKNCFKLLQTILKNFLYFKRKSQLAWTRWTQVFLTLWSIPTSGSSSLKFAWHLTLVQSTGLAHLFVWIIPFPHTYSQWRTLFKLAKYDEKLFVVKSSAKNLTSNIYKIKII